jgi:ubiquinone/menaquinone biosynthesis C-methylase UbiE
MINNPRYKYIPPLAWNILTPIYDLSCTIIGLGKGFKRKVLKSVHLEDGFVVADIGCGTGVFLEIAKKKYPKVQFIGIDPDKKVLLRAKERLDRAQLSVELKEAFAESLPISSESVDVCFSTLAFHHMPNETKLKAMQEIYRILKPNGIIVIADFGKTKSVLFKMLHLFEKLEHLEGNLQGFIEKQIIETGFYGLNTMDTHFPSIKIIKPQKIYDIKNI